MSVVAVVDSSESGDLDHLEQRLITRFSPPLRREEVEQCLVESIAKFKDAPVRTFVLLLIERAATDRLRALVHDPRTAGVMRPSADVSVPPYQPGRPASVGGVR